MTACDLGRTVPLAKVRTLIEGNWNRTYTWEGANILHLVVDLGRVDLVQPLILAGIKLNQVDGRGEVPLDYAVRNGDPEMVRELLLPETPESALIKEYLRNNLPASVKIPGYESTR